MTKWEYMTGEYDTAYTVDELDAEGENGWELAGFAATPWSYVNERKGYTESGTTYRYVFKRPVAEAQSSEDQPHG